MYPLQSSSERHFGELMRESLESITGQGQQKCTSRAQSGHKGVGGLVSSLISNNMANGTPFGVVNFTGMQRPHQVIPEIKISS